MPQEVIDKYEAKLESRMGDIKAAETQRADDMMLSIRQRVDSGKITSYNDLSPDELVALGNHRTSAKNFIESESKKSDKELEQSVAGTDFYYQMREDPLRLKATPIATIMGMRGEIGSARMDKLLTERDRLIKQPDIEKQATVDAQQFKELANRAKVTDKAELVHFQDRAEEAIVDFQNKNRRTATREEKKQIIVSTLTTLPVTTKGLLWGTNTTDKRGGDVLFKQNIQVPEKDRKDIIATLQARGIKAPDDDIIRTMFAGLQASRQGLTR